MKLDPCFPVAFGLRCTEPALDDLTKFRGVGKLSRGNRTYLLKKLLDRTESLKQFPDVRKELSGFEGIGRLIHAQIYILRFRRAEMVLVYIKEWSEKARSWRENGQLELLKDCARNHQYFVALLKDRARNDTQWHVRYTAVSELVQRRPEDPQMTDLLTDLTRSDNNGTVRTASVELAGKDPSKQESSGGTAQRPSPQRLYANWRQTGERMLKYRLASKNMPVAMQMTAYASQL